jgi:glycerol uptake facilitator protein
MSPLIAEFIGTAMLILFGNGVVANVLLSKTNGKDAGWLAISAGWGIAVFIGAFCANDFSGAHLNPAVTIAMLVAGKIGISAAIGYVFAQLFGAMLGAVLVYLFYFQHFRMSDNANVKLACFSTAPVVRSFPQAAFCEMIGTFALILPIFLMVTPSLIQGKEPVDTDPILGLGSLGYLPVAILVLGIGLSLGGTTGYAINPARDLGPRIVHACLPIPGKRDSDWSYAWVPVVAPIVGGVIAAIVFKLLR